MLKIVGSCKEVAKLASRGRDTKLSFSEALAFRFHTMMCKVCRGYTAELKQLAELAKEKQIEFSQTMSEERKQRVREALEKMISEES